MSSSTPSVSLYGVSVGSSSSGQFPINPIRATRDPATTDVKGPFGNFPIGQSWINTSNNSIFELASFSSFNSTITANWVSLGGSSTSLSGLTGDTGSATPSGGSIQIAGTSNQISTAAAGNSVTLALPSAITTPGSLATTTSLRAGSGFTVSAGAMTVTTGTSAINISADNSATTINIGTGSSLKTVTLGSTTGGSTMTLQSAGAMVLNSNGGTLTMHAVGGNISIADGANTSTVTIATGAGVKTITLGSTNSTSATRLQSGSGGIRFTGAVTADNAITVSNGNVTLNTAGNKLVIATGSNASVGTSAAMTAGAVTVSTTACSTTAKVFYVRATTGGTAGNVSITAQDATGFTLTSSSGTETSTFNWWIINN